MHWHEWFMTLSPFLVVLVALYGSHRMAKATIDSNKHQTETVNWRDFNTALQDRLKQVEGPVEGMRTTVDQIQNQVTNGHKTNLRDDVTRVLKLVDLMQGFMENLPNQEDFRTLQSSVDAQMLSNRQVITQLEEKVASLIPVIAPLNTDVVE